MTYWTVVFVRVQNAAGFIADHLGIRSVTNSIATVYVGSVITCYHRTFYCKLHHDRGSFSDRTRPYMSHYSIYYNVHLGRSNFQTRILFKIIILMT